MGDRHGGRFARRGRALSPPRRGFPTARCGVPMARGGGQDLPRAETLPRRKPPDTAHERKDLPHAGTLPTAKASQHGARAKGFAPRRNAPHGEGFPTRRTSERICPAQKRSPRRRPPDTAHERKGLPRAGTLPTAKASRHGARAKGFAPRGFAFAPHADERRAAPDRRTAGKTHLRRGRTRDGARAKGFAPRRNAPHGKGLPTRRTSQRICPAGFALAPRADERRAALDRRTAEKHPFGGVAPERARPLPSSFTEKNKTTP